MFFRMPKNKIDGKRGNVIVILGFIPNPVIRSERSRQSSAIGAVSRYWGSFTAFVKTRTFALTLYVCISMLFVVAAMASTRIVQVVDGGKAKYIYTFRTNPKDILQQYGVTLTSSDEYDFLTFKSNFAQITYFQAFPVKISADSTEKDLLMARGTVSDALKKAGVTLGADDEISVPLEKNLSSGMTIAVGRVTYQTVAETTPIAYQTVTTQTPLLSKNVKTVLVQGREGQTQTTYKQKYVNGVLTDKQMISQVVTAQPVTCQMEAGTAANTPVSSMMPSSGLTLNGSGVPASYAKVIHGTATGYSPKDGRYAATGKTMQVGYVAVNPRVIPYGTKLYVMSSDGSFVYGYAVAVDTGGFATNGSGIDIDLYFNSSYEAGLLGRRSVDIYVLS